MSQQRFRAEYYCVSGEWNLYAYPIGTQFNGIETRYRRTFSNKRSAEQLAERINDGKLDDNLLKVYPEVSRDETKD